MEKKQMRPLGVIMLESGPKEIAVMYDMFTNWHFSKEENWEDLRSIANIFINDYAKTHPGTALRPIEGKIAVETQYEVFKALESGGKLQERLKRQDFKIRSKDVTFMELANKAYPQTPIEEQAVEYYGLGIGSDGRQIANQMWLMAEDIPKLMLGRKYVNYVLKDEVSNAAYPKTSGIMFASLRKLSDEPGAAGELAAFLLGIKIKDDEIAHPEAKKIAKGIRNGFEAFKKDKEVARLMTVRQKWAAIDGVEYWEKGKTEGRTEGKAEGKIEGKVEVYNKELKMPPPEIASKLGMSEKAVLEILAKLEPANKAKQANLPQS